MSEKQGEQTSQGIDFFVVVVSTYISAHHTFSSSLQ